MTEDDLQWKNAIQVITLVDMNKSSDPQLQPFAVLDTDFLISLIVISSGDEI